MNSRQVKALGAALADLQTELNRADRLQAASLHVGTAEDLQVIRMLLATGPLRVGELASRRCSSVATVSARLDRLERRGYVLRERPPGDRRIVVAGLTEKGEEAAKASRREREALLRPLDDVPVETFQQVVEALRGE